ncbi:hypothetical protein D3C78_1463910 [compost metagenome]
MLGFVSEKSVEVHRLDAFEPESLRNVVVQVQVMILRVRPIVFVPHDDSVTLLDHKVHQVHRGEGLGQTRVSARQVAYVGLVASQLGVDVRNSPFGKVVHIEDEAEAGVAEVKAFRAHHGGA